MFLRRVSLQSLHKEDLKYLNRHEHKGPIMITRQVNTNVAESNTLSWKRSDLIFIKFSTWLQIDVYQKL